MICLSCLIFKLIFYSQRSSPQLFLQTQITGTMYVFRSKDDYCTPPPLNYSGHGFSSFFSELYVRERTYSSLSHIQTNNNPPNSSENSPKLNIIIYVCLLNEAAPYLICKASISLVSSGENFNRKWIASKINRFGKKLQ